MSALSSLYGRVTQLHRAWYERHPHRRRRLAQPVISVGNMVLGGSGKTPVVATVARLLSALGERPAILSRGYGRRRAADGVVVVSDDQRVLEDATRSGDEPQMLARALPGVPVLVASDRHLAGRLAECRLGSTVHILDDGFQHLRLARDIELLLVAPQDLDEKVLPAGRLREPLAAAGRADALLVRGTGEDAALVSSRIGGGAAFRMASRYDAPLLIEPFGAPLPQVERRAVAVAGIARPERFFAALRSEGWEIVREMAFRDHHWFSARDVERVSRAADEAGASVILATEKDAMRLLGERPPSRAHLWAFLPMRVAIEPEAAFGEWLRSRLAHARARRAMEAA